MLNIKKYTKNPLMVRKICYSVKKWEFMQERKNCTEVIVHAQLEETVMFLSNQSASAFLTLSQLS